MNEERRRAEGSGEGPTRTGQATTAHRIGGQRRVRVLPNATVDADGREKGEGKEEGGKKLRIRKIVHNFRRKKEPQMPPAAGKRPF